MVDLPLPLTNIYLFGEMAQPSVWSYFQNISLNISLIAQILSL
jgi:hypothetical protein